MTSATAVSTVAGSSGASHSNPIVRKTPHRVGNRVEATRRTVLGRARLSMSPPCVT